LEVQLLNVNADQIHDPAHYIMSTVHARECSEAATVGGLLHLTRSKLNGAAALAPRPHWPDRCLLHFGIFIVGGDALFDWLVWDFPVLGIHFQPWMPVSIILVAGAFWMAFGKTE
jgi:hypothetical protein